MVVRVILFTVGGCVALVVGLAFLSSSQRRVQESTTRAAAAPTAPKPSAPTLCIAPGEVCKLSETLKGEDNWTLTATGIGAAEALTKFLRAGDNEGIADLIVSGRVLTTKAGDMVRVIESGIFTRLTEGRMVTGKYKGRMVFVSRDLVVR